MTFRFNPFNDFLNVPSIIHWPSEPIVKPPKEKKPKTVVVLKSVKGSDEFENSNSNSICKFCSDVLIVDDNSFNVLALDMLLQDMPHMQKRRIDKVTQLN
jgi:hypothetical protein